MANTWRGRGTGLPNVVRSIGAVGSVTVTAAPERRAALKKTMNDGNFKDAYEGLRQMALAAEAEKRLAEARDAARAIGGSAPNLPDVMILGPAPAPLALLRGRYRYRLLVNARRSAKVQDVIREWLGQLTFPQGVRVGVDIDPYSFV